MPFQRWFRIKFLSSWITALLTVHFWQCHICLYSDFTNYTIFSRNLKNCFFNILISSSQTSKQRHSDSTISESVRPTHVSQFPLSPPYSKYPSFHHTSLPHNLLRSLNLLLHILHPNLYWILRGNDLCFAFSVFWAQANNNICWINICHSGKIIRINNILHSNTSYGFAATVELITDINCF